MTESNFLNVAADIPQKLYIHGVKKNAFEASIEVVILKLKQRKRLKVLPFVNVRKNNLGPLQAVFRRCSVKTLSLEIPQNVQKNTCARVSFLIKLQAEACYFIRKDILAQVFL